MGKDSELFKAAQVGNNAVLERAFASYLKKNSGTPGHGFGSVRGKTHPNIQDDQGYTLLHHATLQSHIDTVNLLLCCGASTTISDNSGSCPLHLAAWKGDLEIVKMLVTQGPSRANVNQQNDSEDSALHLASQYGFSEVVEFLLQRHADPLLLNARAESALDLAAQYGHIDTVHLLISHCPEMLFMQRAGFSPLHLAARNGHTVVALSLINAGISVNTVCERGSALHEAAVCGKDDTVELLLDKGVDLDLKDGHGRTVFQVLDEFTAEKAVKIKAMILDHQRSGHGITSPGPPSLRHRNIVAIAGTNCLPVVEESSALAFKRGDTIAVLEKRGDGLFTGTCHGKTGSFLAEDVTFYSQRNGELVEIDVSTLVVDEPIRANDDDLEGVMKVAVSSQDPYEHVPAFPTTNSPKTVSMATNTSSTNYEHMNLTPTTSDSRSSIPSTSLIPDPNVNSVAGRSRMDNKRLSKKDKKFQLSKDTGAYSELQPINPLEAQKEFGETLKLNPVGPAFGGVTEEGQVVTSHNMEPLPDPDGTKFQGSYYVLEVGNFDESARIQISPPHEEPTRDPPQPTRDPLPTTDKTLQPDYYMLDISNFEAGELAAMTETQTANGPEKNQVGGVVHRESAPPTYENIKALTEQQPPPLPKKMRSRSALEATKIVSDKEKSASLRRRDMTYETVTIDGGQAHLSSNSPKCASPIPVPESNQIQAQPDSIPKLHQIQTEPGFIPEQSQVEPDSILKTDQLQPEESDQTQTYPDSNSWKRISTSSDPFAGLVISSSADPGSLSPPTGVTNDFRGRTETIWDNERVEMEWSQIDTLLRDIIIPLPEETPPTETLSSWLDYHGLGACGGPLETNGFDSLFYLGGNILAMDDLDDIGITSPDDQFNLMAAVSLLPPPPTLGHVTSVAQWLEALELSHLEPKFSSYSLERLSGFWEVELAAVIGVEELGHRKRLQYGISELRSTHPEWVQKSPQAVCSVAKATSLYSTLHLHTSQPSQPQVSVGRDHRRSRLSSIVWKHSDEALIKDLVYYKAKYLGSVIIKELQGRQSAEEACLRLKSTTENMIKKPEIILAISWKGVKFVDSHSKRVVSTHTTRDITYCSPDIDDRRIFAYITKDKLSGKHYSHVFMAEKQGIADDIRLTIGQAMDICYQKVMRVRNKLSASSPQHVLNNHTNSNHNSVSIN